MLNTLTTIIKESINETLKEIESILVKTCEDMIAQQMSTININMDNIMKATLVEQQLNKQRLTSHHLQQNKTNQLSNKVL